MPDFGQTEVIQGYSKPTSLQFIVLEDGTQILITSQQKGPITFWKIESEGEGTTRTYTETLLFQTNIIEDIPNYDDKGVLQPNQNDRQITGLFAELDANGEIVVYVTSSTADIGGGGGSTVNDKGLDTNSGVLSKLTIDINDNPDGTGWSADKVDLIRGLPRSEENHSVNGMDMTPDGNLLMMIGGFTNAGAPGQNFAYTPEYWLSGTLVEVDLSDIEARIANGETFDDGFGNTVVYDLPSLGIDRDGFTKNSNNPFGGNDGYNQTYLTADSPLDIFATGFRNAYDVQVVEIDVTDPRYDSTPGADNFLVYTWDNGANGSWGEPTANLEGHTYSVNVFSGDNGNQSLAVWVDGTPNKVIVQPDGSIFVVQDGMTGVIIDVNGVETFLESSRPDNTPLLEDTIPLSPQSQDNLHLVQRGEYYGSPNISQVNPDAVIYLKPEIETDEDNIDSNAIVAPQFATMSLRDYLPPELNGDPLKGYVVSEDGYFFLKPKKGGGNYDGALAVNGGSTNGIVIFEYIEGVHPVELEELDGDLFATGFNSKVIYVDLSEDGTEALNRDDIENGVSFQNVTNSSNPLDITIAPDGSIWYASHGANNISAFVPGGTPLVDDSDDDDDDLSDNTDPFQYDANNGLGIESLVSSGEVFEFTFENEIASPNGLLGAFQGLTGHMLDFGQEYFSVTSDVQLENLLNGGVAGRLQVEAPSVSSGSAEGSANSLTYALQSGINYDPTATKLLIESFILNPWQSTNQEAGQNTGIYFGTGTQADYVMARFAINANGDEVVQIVIETNDTEPSIVEIPAPGFTDELKSPMLMRMVIDTDNMTVQAFWAYETMTGPVSGNSAAIQIDPTGTGNSITEAVDLANEGGFDARGIPIDGQPGDVINQFIGPVKLGLAVGLAGSLGVGNSQTAPAFTPEYDNLLISASNDQGQFAPDARNEDGGAVTVGETQIFEVAELLANDRDLEGGTVSISSVAAIGDATVELISGGTQISYTPNDLNASGFNYEVSNGTLSTTAEVDVLSLPPEGSVIYRVNAGSGTVTAIDGGPDWIGDTTTEGEGFIASTSESNPYTQAQTNAEGEMDLTFLENQADIPWQLFTHERGDDPTPGNLQYAFDVTEGQTYAVTLYYVENWNGIFGSNVPRVFDVAVNGTVPAQFDDINPVQEAADALGQELPAASASNADKQPFLGTAFSKTVIVTADSAELLLEFLPGTQNPKVNAIEIALVSGDPVDPGPEVSIADATVTEGGDLVFELTTSEPASEAITINYEIVPGTAEAGIHYTLSGATPDANGVITGSLLIDSSSDGSITLNTVDDAAFNLARDLTVNITGVTGDNATIATGQGTASGTIENDDLALPEPGEVLFAINAGGSAPVDGTAYGLPGVTFETDTQAANNANLDLTGATTGNMGTGNNTNTNGADDTFVNPDGTPYVGDTTLFESERWTNNFGYNFDVPNGDYVVDLYFAETFVSLGDNTGGVGTRKFDVAIEGGTVLDDLDLFDEGDGTAGDGEGLPLVPIIRTFEVTVTDGVLDIDLNSLAANGGADNAKISAIVVKAAGGDPIPATISIAAPADAEETGDNGFTTLDFDVSFDFAPSEAATVSYSVSVNGTETVASADLDLGTTGGVISVDVANDELDNGADSVVVTLLSTTASADVAVLDTVVAATASVTEDDSVLVPTPTDIDGDGVLNGDDPFADDGDNGDAKVLVAGGEFVQDFNTDSSDPFSAETGFTGILVNPDFDAPGASETDPYGDRTTDGNGTTSGGFLSVTSSNEDSFGPTGAAQNPIAANNIIKDNYQSAVDVTGTDSFEIVANAKNPWFGGTAPTSFASLGITVGAGGVDDWVKLVFGGSNQGPRIELADQGSLNGDNNSITVASQLPDLDVTTIADIEFQIVIDKTAGTNGQLTGFVTFFGDDGSSLGTVTTPVRDITSGGSLEASIDGQNPLTGGDGGLAYGISITDYNGGADPQSTPSFTAEYDSLTIRSLDAAVADALVSIADAPTVVESGDAGTTTLAFDISADDGFTGDLDVAYTLDTGDGSVALTQTVSLTAGAGMLTADIDNDDVDDGAETATVVLTGITTVGYTVDTVAATATGTVNEDEFNVPVDEAVDGDLSDDNLAPTDVKIGLGDNVITAGQQGIVDPDDRDFFTITVAEGQVLDAIILQDFQTTEEEGLPNLAFIALKEGATFDSDIDALEAQAASPIAEGLLGGATYGTGNIGFDILASMNTTDFVGFSLPLQAGTYSFWLNQNGPESTATLNFQVSSIGEVSIGDAGEVVESGDDATSTTIIFPITSTPAREGSLGLVAEINVDGVVQTTNANVTVDASGTGSLAITLPNDDVDDGADAVTVTITSVNSTVYSLGAQATGTATITEDDAIDTSDLDEDGVVNALDPAYLDATNGLSNVLEAGQTIGVEFNEAGPVDPLSEGTGLSGVNVNPDETGTGDDVDPYLGATDASGKIENGLLSVTATDGDSFNDNNASQNDYGFMLNTSDTDSFTVTSKIVAPDGGIPAVKFAAFGIQIGDGTQESYIKVARASIGDGNPIIDIRWDNDDAHQDANPANTGTGGGALSQAITLDATQAAAPAYILSMDIDRSDPANITVTPRIQPVDAAGVPVGAEIVAQTFVVTGDIAAAINGMNPSTGPNGGGLFVGAYSTSFNDAEDFTASWDYLRVTSNDTPADTVAPTASIVGSAVYYAETSVGVQVRFTDDTLLDASSITADGLVVTVNGVEYSADFVSTTVLTDRLIDARFNFPEPDGGWPIGPFDIVLNDGAVLDAAGNPSAEVLGSGVIEPQTYVGFNQDLIEVVEGGNTDSTSVQFEILITPPAAQDLLVSYAWSVNGGEEQTVSSETVSFDENGVGIVTVFIENDDVDNGPDDVDIRLTGLGGRLGLRFEPFASSATATVTEDDAPILVSISDAPLLIEQGDTGVSLLGFPLALSVAEEATLDLIVEYAINGGEVQSVTLNGVVFDTAGMAAAVIEVQNNNLDDGSETVSVELISVTTVGYEVDGDNNTATGTVTEDDAIPSVASPIEAQAADEDAAFSFTIPDGTFADEDGEAALTLAATLDDDSALPSWLAFDAETKTFSGTPENGDVGAISIKLTATDEAGQSVETNFDLTVNNTNDAPVVTVFQQELDATSGIETVFSIAGLVEVTDEDVGDSVTLTVRPTEPDILVENGNIIVPASFSEPFFEVDFIATDSSGVSGFGTIVVNLTEAPDVTPPVGTFTSTVSVTPGQPLVIEVTYSDDREVDASTFGADDVTVTDPVGGDVTPTDFSIDGNVVTYTFTPPTGGWTAGPVDVNLIAASVTDAAGNAIEAAMTSVTILPEPDVTAPTATILPVADLASPAENVVVQVQYADDDAFDGSTVDEADLTLDGVPSDSVQYSSATGIATYTFLAPVGGWTVTAPVIDLLAGAVTDLSGNGNAAAQSSVNIAPIEVSMTIEPTQATTLVEEDEDFVEITLSLSEATDVDVIVTFEVTGDATAEDFFVDPPMSVTIPAGQTFAPLFLEILNDQLVEAPEALNLAITSTTTGVISTTDGGVSFTLTSGDTEAPVTGVPIVIEAETFTGLDSSDYFAQGSSAASANGLIRLNSRDATTVETELPDTVTPGVYTVEITYFDEDDGQSSATAMIGDQAIGSWVFNNDGGGSGAQASNIRNIEFTNVTITDGDVFKLIGQRDAGEFVRIDKITLTRTGDVAANQPPSGTDIQDTAVDEGAAVAIAFDYTDPEQDTLTITTTLADGSALPAWLVADASGITGTAPAEAAGQSFDILVTIDDGNGNVVTDTFALAVNDKSGPIATVTTGGLVGNQDDLTITVTFTDATGINASTVVPDVLLVEGPDGTVYPASGVVFEPATNTATFTVPAPDGGFPPGDYDVSLIDEAVEDTLGNVSAATAPEPLVIEDTSAPLGANLDEDFDEDGVINSADGDIDEDGVVNAVDKFAYDAANGALALADEGSITIDLAGLEDGDSPFTAGFTGVLPGFSPTTVELDYATNNGAAIVAGPNGNRLVFESSPADTNEAINAFTFGSTVSGDFTLSGTFDNPYFGPDEAPQNFEQYGLIIGLDGGTFMKFATGSPGADFELSGKTGNVNDGASKTSPLADKSAHAATKLDMDVVVEPGAVTFNGTWTTLDVDGTVLATGVMAPVVLTSGALYDAIQGGTVPVSFGVSSTHTGGAADPFPVSLSELSLVDGNIDVDGPTAVITADDIADGDADVVVTVSFEDATGVDAATIDGDEITLIPSDNGDVVPAAQFADNGDGTYTYTFAAPDGGWASTSFSAALTAGSVADTLANVSAAGTPIEFGREDVDPVDQILENLTGVDEDGEYGNGDTGSVILTIMDGESNVRSSNFGANSFELTNTGDKQVAAVFIDVSDALYGDSVFDFDGSGGDTVAKIFGVNSETGDGTGAVFEGAGSYFLPGDQPIPNTSGGGVTAAGGFRGLLIKFDGSEGGFSTGELVGFSGDMDPNSIAGLLKGSGASIGVDDGAIDGWDVGGVSGAELIGSSFTVVFDDGTTADGYLHSDGSLAGSVGEAVQGRATSTVNVLVNGFDSTDTDATYGGIEPVIFLTGTPGDIVRVVMTQGFNPVTETTGGIADIVAERLATQHPEFQANNAFNFQTVDVEIGANGTATVPAGSFDYNAQPGNVDNPDVGISPIAITAAVIVDATDTSVTEKVAVGPVADPVYLTNPTQTPVDPTPPAPEGYFQGIDTGNGFRFKVQIEDVNIDNGGENPGGDWVFVPEEDSTLGNAQGTGYYYWEFLGDGNLSPNAPQEDSFLTFNIFIPEGEEGEYTVRFRSGRESNDPNDARNDIWLKINDDAEALQVNETDSVSNSGFIKIFGGGTGGFGYAQSIDSVLEEEANFGAVFELDAGFHTITLAGRSPGFNVDFIEINKGGNPGVNSANSQFVATGDTVPVVNDQIEDINVQVGDGLAFAIPGDAFFDADGDTLFIDAPNLPTGFTFVNGVLSAESDLAIGSYPITITATDDDLNVAVQTFVVTVSEDVPVSDFQAIVVSGADDIELGSSLNSPDLESDKVVQLRFTVQEGVSNVTSVETAFFNFVSDRGQGGTTTLNFEARPSYDALPFESTNSFVGDGQSVTFTDSWDDNEFISGVIDLAPLINDLIADQGPLNAGDIINLQFTGTGADRYIVQGTGVLDISGTGGGGGPTNLAPVVDNPVADLEVADGDGVNINLANVFSDPEDDALTLQVSGLPDGVSFSGTTISGTPTETGVFTVTVTANDGEKSVADVFVITVLTDQDTMPVVGADIADQSVLDGEAYSFAIPANAFTDLDGDTLEITVDAPAGFGFNANTDTVTAAAGLAAGTYTITVTATDDDNNSVSQDYTVTKLEPFSSAPVVDVDIPDQSVADGEAYSFAIPANAFDDADGDTLEITVNAPAGFGYNANTDTVTAPVGLAAGVYTITVTATDDDNNSISQDYVVTKEEPFSSEPEVDVEIPDQTVNAGDAFSFAVPANAFDDADGDALTITATSLPNGFSFNPANDTVTAPGNLAPGTYTITVQAEDDDGNTVTQDFNVTVVDTSNTFSFVAELESKNDDVELGFNERSSELETNKAAIQMRLTIEDGVAGATFIESALVSWTAINNSTGSAVLTFQVEDSLAPEAYGANKSFVGGSVQTTVQGPWFDDQLISNVVDIAPLLNALIASQGPLSAGDVINLQIDGVGDNFQIQQFSTEVAITASGAPPQAASSAFASFAAPEAFALEGADTAEAATDDSANAVIAIVSEDGDVTMPAETAVNFDFSGILEAEAPVEEAEAGADANDRGELTLLTDVFDFGEVTSVASDTIDTSSLVAEDLAVTEEPAEDTPVVAVAPAEEDLLDGNFAANGLVPGQDDDWFGPLG